MRDDDQNRRGEQPADGADEDLFREAMSDVERLENPRVGRDRERRDPTLAQITRRQNAAEHRKPPEDPNFLHQGEVALVGPHDELSWKKDGVQDGVFRKLKQGAYPVDAELDLHRLTVREAREAVFRFLVRSRARGLRTLLIAHGRGEKSDPPARIKSYVNHWLEQAPDVIAFHSAVRQRGGTGAVCLLLKKSPQQSEDNRERFS